MTSVSEQVRAAVRRGDLGWLTGHLGAGGFPPGELPVSVRLVWLRAEIADAPSTVQGQTGELLYQAVAGIAAVDTDLLDELIGELVAGGDLVLHREALRLAREGLRAALLAPARAREHLTGLLASPSVAVPVLRELAEPWAALAAVGPERLRTLLTADAPETADAAIAVAARHGHGDLLRDVVADEAMPPATRQQAMRALGELAAHEDVGALAAYAATDPLLLAAPTIACLRAMHRRGHFPAAADAEAVVGLALADHSVPSTDVATIVFTCRGAAFDALLAAEAADDSWPRRLDLLVDLARQGGGDLPVGEAITGLLAGAARPEPLLAAIRALRHVPAEASVLEMLPRTPGAALRTLEAIGGPRTAAVLWQGLGLPDGDAVSVMAPHLWPVRDQALELLWHLVDDPRRRTVIVSRLNPRDVPRRIAADLGAPDRRELALLAAGFAEDDPVQALLSLARQGDTATLPTIADLLLRIVADLAASGEPSGPASPWPPKAQHPDVPPSGEPSVPDEVVDAIQALGERLRERGKLRPFCLREAADAAEAGRALLATTALDLLDRPGLSGGEQAALLVLLRRVPYAGTRARVHRLLRHRDRHVRKHVIALLAADTTGGDAEALSASLITLVTAPDRETVRQALLALGHVRAHWAAPVIAAALDHPVMNIKKTAADVLVHAGTPATVPELLFWLGRHDNPGLRASLIRALRAILGDAYTATVLAAAEQSDDERSRELLLRGLDGVPSARAVGALARQGSPVAPVLLALIAAQQVRLACGTVGDLAAQFAAHGIAAPAAPPPAGPSDEDIATLVRDGWDTAAALRIVSSHTRQPEHLRALDEPRGVAAGRAHRSAQLRPMLADWLRLAADEPALRPATLRLTLRLCPAPWPSDELKLLGRSARTLVAALADATGDDRDDLLAVLEAVAPTLPRTQAVDLAARLRALPPTAAGKRSALPVLRGCGAVLTRADVEQALAGARLGADPWRGETAVLRDAFAITATPGTGEAAAWRRGLEAAVRTTEALGAFRAGDDGTVPSRHRLDALIDLFPAAHRDARDALLDWMETLQPVGAPPWTIAEDARRPVPAPRAPRDGDLDQPRSAAQRDRLLAMLDGADAGRRDTAATALLTWPEPETARAVLRAYLRGSVDVTVRVDLARALATIDEAELRTLASGSDTGRERIAAAALHLDAPDLHRLIALLVHSWENGGPATRAAAAQALGRVPDAVAQNLGGRLYAGAWGLLDLIAGRTLLRTPALVETVRRLRAEGRDDLADKLTLVDGPLREPSAAADDAARLAALRERPTVEPAPPGPAGHELISLIRTGRPEQVRRALTRLAEAREDDRSGADPELVGLLAELLHHPETGVRLHAHRIGRRLLDRPTHLRHTALLLGDREPAVVRSAVEALGHAGYQAAIPEIIGLLAHAHPSIRTSATQALVRFGVTATPALRHAAGHARPDRRHRYETVLAQIAEQEERVG
ncbi:hypothetical protein Cme02nite_73710 [Catellatospora methionotrophica]|uniref:HEAT repeat protein n=1 Tax=Catellatospora methionotrophica TaxID=121620 RepID=A0A8J3PJP8_9ACTN|nr:HEAT repeat domain-containing protein [Catellatospora methionotrophica]GIG19039.1 hypothetical protein Cme02nite_73710 [Catellatospora methionotrophica]